jgi:hypothetical protein
MGVLVLDHVQRMNLHALIGAQRANVDDMRMFWRVQDRIELSPDEKQAIGYQVRSVDGHSQIGWDASRTLPAKEFEFGGDEFKKLRDLVLQWQPGYMIAADRTWLEPLLGQLENGSAAK